MVQWNVRLLKLGVALFSLVVICSCNLLNKVGSNESQFNRFERKEGENGESFRWFPVGVAIGREHSLDRVRVAVAWEQECQRLKEKINRIVQDRFDEFDCGEEKRLKSLQGVTYYSHARVSLWVEPEEELETKLLTKEVPEMPGSEGDFNIAYFKLTNVNEECEKISEKNQYADSSLFLFDACEVTLEFPDEGRLPNVIKASSVAVRFNRPGRKTTLKPLKFSKVHSLVAHPNMPPRVFVPKSKGNPTTALTVSNTSEMAMWDLKTGTMNWLVTAPFASPTGNDLQSRFSAPVVRFSDDQTQIFVGLFSGAIERMDAASGELISAIETQRQESYFTRAIELTRDEKTIVTLEQHSSCGNEEGSHVNWDFQFDQLRKSDRCESKIQVYRIDTQKEVAQASFGSTAVQRFNLFSVGDSDYLLFVDSKTVSVLRVDSLEVSQSISADQVNPGLKGAYFSGATVSEDGRFLALSTNFGVAIVEVSTAKVISRLHTNEKGALLGNPSFVNQGKGMMVSTRLGEVFHFDLTTRSLVSIHKDISIRAVSPQPVNDSFVKAGDLFILPTLLQGSDDPIVFSQTRNTIPDNPDTQTFVITNPVFNQPIRIRPSFKAGAGVVVWKVSE